MFSNSEIINDMLKVDEYCKNFEGQVSELAKLCTENGGIDTKLYNKYEVKRGLRDLNGRGVVAGLTEISEVCASRMENGKEVPCEGKLYYRGIDVEDIVKGFTSEKRFGFEETTYLLLFGNLPNKTQLDEFTDLIAKYRVLPQSFVRDVILKAPSTDMMNMLSRGVLALHAYDSKANDISIPNVLSQCIKLTAIVPLLAVYGYQAYNHYHAGNSLYIHSPKPELSTAENILRILRPDSSYTTLEAKVLDLAMVLHAEHGGGNNSTFTNHVVTSSGTDTYSAVAASLCSLKGPRHGGANVKVYEMFEDIKEKVKDWNDEDEIAAYLKDLLYKRAFDNSGLIYGMGHAVYSLSDPRTNILKKFVGKLAEEKNKTAELNLYMLVEKLAPTVIANERKIYKGVSANIDFYSGFIYSMLKLPKELYTPLFAMSRMAGWSAHRIEELTNAGKIIRPAYKSVSKRSVYVPLDER